MGTTHHSHTLWTAEPRVKTTGTSSEGVTSRATDAQDTLTCNRAEDRYILLVFITPVASDPHRMTNDDLPQIPTALPVCLDTLSIIGDLVNIIDLVQHFNHYRYSHVIA